MLRTAEQEARDEAAGKRELAAILRHADRKSRVKRHAPESIGTLHIMPMLGIRSPQTLAAWIATGKFPPPTRKAPGRNGKRVWPLALVRAIAFGLLPQETKHFTSPKDWQEWLRDHYSHEEFSV